MPRISTVIIRLTDEDFATKGGMHILAQMVSSYINQQFDLDVAIRLEDERGAMISESIPLSATTTAENNSTSASSWPTGSFVDLPACWESDTPDPIPASIAGLIGN